MINIKCLKKLVLISRPFLWYYTLIPLFMGLLIVKQPFNTLTFLLILYFTLPFNLFFFGLNDIFDYKSDKINKRKNSYEGVVINHRERKFIIQSIIAINLPFVVLIITHLHRLELILFFLFFLFICYSYSCPPFIFGKKHFLGQIWNLYYLFPFLLPQFLEKRVQISYPDIVLFAAFLVGAHAITAIQDTKYDKFVGFNTTPVLLGPRNTALFASIIYITGLYFYPTNFPFNILLYICLIASLTLILNPSKSRLSYKLTFLGFLIFTVLWFLEKLVEVGIVNI